MINEFRLDRSLAAVMYPSTKIVAGPDPMEFLNVSAPSPDWELKGEETSDFCFNCRFNVASATKLFEVDDYPFAYLLAFVVEDEKSAHELYEFLTASYPTAPGTYWEVRKNFLGDESIEMILRDDGADDNNVIISWRYGRYIAYTFVGKEHDSKNLAWFFVDQIAKNMGIRKPPAVWQVLALVAVGAVGLVILSRR